MNLLAWLEEQECISRKMGEFTRNMERLEAHFGLSGLDEEGRQARFDELRDESKEQWRERLATPPDEDPFCIQEILSDDMKRWADDFSKNEALPDKTPVVLNRYEPPNWFSEYGAAQKIKELEKKGIPDFNNARHIVATINRDLFAHPQEAYEVGKRHLRQFMYDLRRDIIRRAGQRSPSKKFSIRIPYCWKLEFQAAGWPHWHIVLLWRKAINVHAVNALWGKGRCSVQRIKGQSFSYIFKYLTKSAPLPDWVLEYERIRIFQASPGFYTNCEPTSSRPPGGKHKKRKVEPVSLTLGERIARWARTFSVRTDARGAHRYRVVCDEHFTDILVEQARKQLSGDCMIQVRNAHEVKTTKNELIWILRKQLNPTETELN